MSQPFQYRCPYCSSTERPLTFYKTSTAGWILFIVLLIACFPLCFLGFFLRDTHQICGSCRTKIS